MGIQGSGEILTIASTCKDFMDQVKTGFWAQAESDLNSDYQKFAD